MPFFADRTIYYGHRHVHSEEGNASNIEASLRCVDSSTVGEVIIWGKKKHFLEIKRVKNQDQGNSGELCGPWVSCFRDCFKIYVIVFYCA